MSLPRFWLALLAATLSLLTLPSCRREATQVTRVSGFEEFIPLYNRYIRTWLESQQQTTQQALGETEATLTQTSDPALRAKLDAQLAELRHEAEKIAFRLSLGDYLRTASPAELPPNLVWQQGLDQPEIGDPAAVKGGVFRKFILGFPPTLRPIGDNANHSFRGDLYDNIDLPLVTLHPSTMEVIPGTAASWALSADGRTTYFRIDPSARYSNGKPVRARDFQLSVYLQVSDYIVNPSGKQYYRDQFAQVAVYDDLTLSVTLPEAKIYAPVYAGSLTPSEPEFYRDYGPDYNERYQWLFPPTTGAYEVLPEDVVKGVSVTQSRVKDWWAKDRKYYRHRFNPDKIVHTVVRDESKAFELFRAGMLDTFFLTRPDYWYEKSEMEPIYRGYIERATFFNQYPKVPRGLYLNVTKPPLNDRRVRVGLQHALNWQKVIDVMFRGDYQRLNAFNEGYGPFSDPTIVARPYSNELARSAFREAGFTVEGPDGILSRPDGTRLTAAVTYPAIPIIDRQLAILREEAKRCGFDLRLDGLDATVAYKKQMQKEHELVFGSWLVGTPIPDFHQFLHSSHAFDEKGNPRPQTNNTFVWSRADTDRLCELTRAATTREELASAAHQLQRIMHDEAIFSPGYSVDFIRVGSWRWVRWPDCETTRFSPPVVFDPHDAFVYWIDPTRFEETQSAMRTGTSFQETSRVIDTRKP